MEQITEYEYKKKDFYERLEIFNYVCYEVRNGLKSIVNDYAAYEYIEELYDYLDYNFRLFSKDEELKDKKKLKLYIDDINAMLQVRKSRGISHEYFVDVLMEADLKIKEYLPKNVQLARLFVQLCNQGKEIAELIDTDEETYFLIMNKMLKNSDNITMIIATSKEERKNSLNL